MKDEQIFLWSWVVVIIIHKNMQWKRSNRKSRTILMTLKKSSVVMSIYVAILFTSLRCWISNYYSSLKPSIITNTSWAFKRFLKLWLNMIQLNSKFMSVKWWCRIRGAIQVEKHSMIYFSVIRSWHKFEYGWENRFFFTWIQVLLVNTSKCSWYDSKCFW